MRAKFEFKLEDLWIGAYWERKWLATMPHTTERWDVWICFIPCFPLHIVLTKELVK